jgi:hypothetical protein
MIVQNVRNYLSVTCRNILENYRHPLQKPKIPHNSVVYLSFKINVGCLPYIDFLRWTEACRSGDIIIYYAAMRL